MKPIIQHSEIASLTTSGIYPFGFKTRETITIEPLTKVSDSTMADMFPDIYYVVKRKWCGVFNYQCEYLFQGTYKECNEYLNSNG